MASIGRLTTVRLITIAAVVLIQNRTLLCQDEGTRLERLREEIVKEAREQVLIEEGELPEKRNPVSAFYANLAEAKRESEKPSGLPPAVFELAARKFRNKRDPSGAWVVGVEERELGKLLVTRTSSNNFRAKLTGVLSGIAECSDTPLAMGRLVMLFQRGSKSVRLDLSVVDKRGTLTTFGVPKAEPGDTKIVWIRRHRDLSLGVGVWEGTAKQLNRQFKFAKPSPVTLEIQRNGSTFSGRIRGDYFNENKVSELEITDTGDISFELSAGRSTDKRGIGRFSGRVIGDRLTGELEFKSSKKETTAYYIVDGTRRSDAASRSGSKRRNPRREP